MFELTAPLLTRKFLLAGMLALTLLCAGAGGTVWHVTRCNMLDYLNRAAPVPLHPREHYLFACGYVWRSVDGGRVWTRQPVRGLPFGVRDGHIAVDRRAGLTYLGILMNGRSSRYCLDCAWTKRQPAIYVSTDGGRNWSCAYKFKRGPADSGGFLGLFADPDREGAVWAVIQNDDEIAYYATGTSGQFWKEMCTEYYFAGSGSCDVPGNVLQFQFTKPSYGGNVGQ